MYKGPVAGGSAVSTEASRLGPPGAVGPSPECHLGAVGGLGLGDAQPHAGVSVLRRVVYRGQTGGLKHGILFPCGLRVRTRWEEQLSAHLGHCCSCVNWLP